MTSKKEKTMQITLTLSDAISPERVGEIVRKIEKSFEDEEIAIEIKGLPSEKMDPWDSLDFESLAVDTGIEDFAENHDHYLYGTPKRSTIPR
jgi:hypothetical protein